jgi:hypothetical protein
MFGCGSMAFREANLKPLVRALLSLGFPRFGRQVCDR